MPVIAVFGSGIIQAGEPEYQDAYEIGKKLSAAGYQVMTGGYRGIMEAVSRGAAENGGSVTGVTYATIETLRQVKPNPWVQKIIPYNTLRERLIHLITQSDGYIAMPGGIGTLAELVMVWEMVRTRDLPPRPLVCYSPYWETMLASFRGNPYVMEVSWELLSFASTPDAVIENIRKGL